MCRILFVKLEFVQWRWPEAEGPDEKMSHYTRCPATQGWTLEEDEDATKGNRRGLAHSRGRRFEERHADGLKVGSYKEG
jgi:hypothetical protein